MKITMIYDNDGKTHDRYTVVTDLYSMNGMYMCLGLSDNPAHPQGFSQWSQCISPNDELGQTIKFSDLPLNVQDHVQERMKES